MSLNVPVCPVPSSPCEPSPQQYPALVAVTAQVWNSAALMDVTVGTSETRTGVVLLTLGVPVPSWPPTLNPQQSAMPLAVTAQVFIWAALTDAKMSPPPA